MNVNPIITRAELILFVFINVVTELVSGTLKLKPTDSETKINSFSFFNCSTNFTSEEILWFHYKIGTTERKLVYGYGKFYPPYQGRFELEKREGSSEVAFNLVIRSVLADDAGTYECQDGAGHGENSPQVQLIVLENDPECSSDINPEGVIGPNICGIQSERLHFWCKVKFHGNQPPIMKWVKKGSDRPISEGATKAATSNLVLHNLTLKAESSIDGLFIQCSSTRSPSVQYQCSSDVVHVVGSKTSTYYVVVIVVLASVLFVAVLLVGVFACRRLLCKTVKERQDNGPECVNMSVTDSYEKERLLREETERLTQQMAEEKKLLERKVSELNEDNRRLTTKLNELEQIIYSKENVPYSIKPAFIKTIETGKPENKKESKYISVISGMTLLNDRLFVVHQQSSKIEIYDSHTFNYEGNFDLQGFLYNLIDIASLEFAAEKLLFVVGKQAVRDDSSQAVRDDSSQAVRDDSSQDLIVKVNIDGTILKRWSIHDNDCRVSTFGSTIIVCMSKKLEIIEYSFEGEATCRVKLSPSNGFEKLWHAIKITKSTYAVSHRVTRSKKDRLSIVDYNGNVNLALDDKTETLNTPICLIEAQNKFIVLADMCKERILLINSSLNFCKEIIGNDLISLSKKLIGYPVRVCLDVPNGRLFIALCEPNKTKTWKNGKIAIFNLKSDTKR